MSVVNKMLQDLESRQHEPMMANADYQPPNKASTLPRVTLGVVLVIGALATPYFFGVFDKFLASQTPKDITVNLSNSDTPKVATPAKQNEAVTSESQIDVIAQPIEEVSEPSEAQEIQETEETLSETFIDSESTISDTGEKAENSVPVVVKNVPAEEQAPDFENVEQPAAQPVFELSNSANTAPKRDLKQLVQDALDIGDSAEAIRLLSQMLELEPRNQPARKKLAALLFAQKQQRSTETILLEGLELHPQSAELRLMLARLYSQNTQINQAHDLLSAYSPSALLEPEYLAFRASLAEQINRFTSAKSDYFQLAEAFPDNAKWWLGLAVTLERLGESDAASQAYLNAMNLNQLSSEVSNFVQQRLRFLEDSQ